MHVNCPKRGAVSAAEASDRELPDKSDNLNAPGASTRLERLAYSVLEAAAVTGLSRSKLYELIQSGGLSSIKIGGRRLIRHADLVALLGSGAE